MVLLAPSFFLLVFLFLLVSLPPQLILSSSVEVDPADSDPDSETDGEPEKEPDTRPVCYKGEYWISENLAAACPAGSYCPTCDPPAPLLCERGNFCPVEGLFRQKECPVGSICPEYGMLTPFACPVGFFCDETGMAQGHLCPPGGYCPKTGLVDPVPCPSSHYCPDAGLTYPGQPCSPRYDCLDIGLSEPPLCPPGFVCDEGFRTPCLAGWICPGKGLLSSEAMQCPLGHYCPSEGLFEAIICPVGHYCPFEGLIQPISCGLGTYCPAEGLVEGWVCSAGHVCDEVGLVNQKECPIGHHCPDLSMAGAIPCDVPGYHCSETGLVHPLICPQGYICPVGNTATPVGAGFYSPVAGAVAGKECEPGYYCPDAPNIGMTLCPMGSFCPESRLAAPILCMEKYECPDPGMMDVGRRCDAREACPEGTALARLCPRGFFCADSIPLLCTEGFYCPDEGMLEFEKVPCPPGFFCPLGVSQPTICPVGTVCPFLEMSSPLQCPSGTFCPSEGCTDARGIICPKGHYCPGGTAGPVPCPPGTFGVDEGLDKCNPCPRGYFCEGDLDQPKPCHQAFDGLPSSIRSVLKFVPPLILCPLENMSRGLVWVLLMTYVFAPFLIIWCLVFCRCKRKPRPSVDVRETVDAQPDEGLLLRRYVGSFWNAGTEDKMPLELFLRVNPVTDEITGEGEDENGAYTIAGEVNGRNFEFDRIHLDGGVRFLGQFQGEFPTEVAGTWRSGDADAFGVVPTGGFEMRVDQ